MNKLNFLFAIVALTVLGGCAHVDSVSLTPIPTKRANQVKAEAEKTVFLAFNFDNDFVNAIVEDLKRQCPNGVVSGILTKQETIAYVIVFKHKVTATGYCNSTIAKRTSGSKRVPSSEETAEEGIE